MKGPFGLLHFPVLLQFVDFPSSCSMFSFIFFCILAYMMVVQCQQTTMVDHPYARWIKSSFMAHWNGMFMDWKPLEDETADYIIRCRHAKRANNEAVKNVHHHLYVCSIKLWTNTILGSVQNARQCKTNVIIYIHTLATPDRMCWKENINFYFFYKAMNREAISIALVTTALTGGFGLSWAKNGQACTEHARGQY